MCEPEGHRFLSLLDYKYACAYKGCEAVWRNLCRESGLRAHLKEHRNVACNVCGQQLPKSDLWLRNFDQDLRILGKHYDSHLMEDGGIPVHGYRCRVCNYRLNISVDTTSSCKDKCANLKFRSTQYVEETSCKTGTDIDVKVICPDLTVVKDLPIKRPPETDGLGREPREEAWRDKRRMFNGDSSDSDTASNQVPTDYFVTNTGDSAADSSGGNELLGLITDSDNILPNPEVRKKKKKKRKVLRKSKNRSDSYLKRKRDEVESEGDSDPPPTPRSRRRRYIGGDALYKAYMRRKEGLPSEDSDSVESVDFSPGWFNPYVRNVVDPGKVKNKRKRRSPIVISDESTSSTSSAESVVEPRRAKTTVFKAHKSARMTRRAPIVTISSEEDSERKRRRMDSTLNKLGVSESAQARIKASVATMKKIPPVEPKKVPRRKCGSSSCSGSCSSLDSGNVSKSKCSTCDSDNSDVKFPNGSRGRRGTPRIHSDESSDTEQSKRNHGQNTKIGEIDLIVMLSSDEDKRKNNLQKSRSVTEKLSALGKLGISKSAQDKILASVKNNIDNSKMEVSSNLKRKEKSTVVATTWRSTPCDSSSCSESGNSSSLNCTSHCGQSGILCTCSSSHTGNTHACCSSVESISCEELTAQGKQSITVGGNFKASLGNKSKLGGNLADPPVISIE